MSGGAGSSDLNLNSVSIDPEAVRLVSPDACRKYRLIPLRRTDREIVVAMTDPDNLFAVDDLAFMTGLKITALKASEEQILAAITRFVEE